MDELNRRDVARLALAGALGAGIVSTVPTIVRAQSETPPTLKDLDKRLKKIEGLLRDTPVPFPDGATFQGTVKISDELFVKNVNIKAQIDALESRIKQLKNVKRGPFPLTLGSGTASAPWHPGGGTNEMFVRVVDDATEILAICYEPDVTHPLNPAFPTFSAKVLGPQNNIRGIGVVFAGSDQREAASRIPCTLSFNVVYIEKVVTPEM